jgi:phage terminase large subunit-like protein
MPKKVLPKKVTQAITFFRAHPFAIYYPEFRGLVAMLDDYKVSENIKRGVPRYLTDPQQDFAKSRANERWFVAANRAGKTFIGAQEVAWWAKGKHPFRKVPEPPNLIWAGFPDFKNHGRPITVPLLKWALGREGVEYKRAADMFEVKAINGMISRIYLKSYDSGADKWQGDAPDLIWFDEVPQDQSIYNEAGMRIGEEEALNIIGTMTPLNQCAWLYSDLYEPWVDMDKPSHTAFIEADIYSNVHLSKAAITRAEDKYKNDPDQAKVRLQGKWAHIAGRVYPMLSALIHIVPDFEIPGVHRAAKVHEEEEPWTLYRAVDVGIRNNSVILWVACSPDGLCYVYRELSAADKSIPEMCRIGLSMETEHEKANGFEYSVIDPSSAQRDPATGMARVDTYANVGIVCIKGNNDWVFGVSRMKDAFSYVVSDDGTMTSPPKYRFFRSCTTVWNEHRRYAYAQTAGSSVSDPREAAIKKDDHTCLAGWQRVITPYGATRIRDLAPSGLIMTPAGWAQYEHCRVTGVKLITRLELEDGSVIDGTEDHKLLTKIAGFDAMRYIVPGDVLLGVGYGPSGDLPDFSRVAWNPLLPLRGLLSEGWEASASVGLGGDTWPYPEGDARSSQGWGRYAQFRLQPATQDSSRPSPRAYDPGEESRLSKKYDRGSRPRRESLALIRRWVEVASEAWERSVRELAFHFEDVRRVWSGVPYQGSEGHYSVLPPELQDEGDEEEKAVSGMDLPEPEMVTTERVVVRRTTLAAATVYNLTVPGVGAYILENGIISRNCDSLRYLEATGAGPTFKVQGPDVYALVDEDYESDEKTGY